MENSNKTIIIVYTHSKLKKTDIEKVNKYAFNSSFDLKEGDMIVNLSGDRNIQVVKVLDRVYKYYNSLTGELSDSYTSTAQWEIKDLIVRNPIKEESTCGVLLKSNEIKTYVFSFPSGWIGGSGVVVANTIEKALELANEQAFKALFIPKDKKNWIPLKEEDLKEVPNNTCHIITNGSY